MKTLRFLFVLLLICSFPMCAFAMDEGYLGDSTKWQSDNDDVVHIPEQNIGSYNGIYNYYSDVANNCFYLQLSYEEGSLENSDNDIYLKFNITNDAREYQLRIDESGFINSGDYAPKTFNVEQNFGEASEQGQEIYIGIEILNKDDKKLNNRLSFSLVVNGYTYHLCDTGIELAYGDYAESPTTNNPPTAQESSTKQTTTEKESTTKFKYTYTTTTAKPAEKESNSAMEETTKFKYGETANFSSSGGDVQEAALGDTPEESTTAPNAQYEANHSENTVVIPEANSAAESTLPAKLLTAAAVICIVAGIAVIARSLSKKKTADE